MAISVNPQFVLIFVFPVLAVGIAWGIGMGFELIKTVVSTFWNMLGL